MRLPHLSQAGGKMSSVDQLDQYPWTLTIRPKIPKFSKRGQMVRKFLAKVPENREIVEFPKSEPFNRKFRKFRDENQMERKFPGKSFRKFGYTSRGCPLFGKLCKLAIFYSALVLLAASPRSSQTKMTATCIRNGLIFYSPLVGR